MLRFALCSAIGLLAAIPLGITPSKPATSTDLKAALDSFITSRLASDSFSGVVLFAPAGGHIYQRAGGIANRERNTMMTLDTRLQIASTTKLFTNIAIRQLEQAGRLSLTDTVGKFLPNYRNATVRSQVTIDQLLRHRSGVGSFWNARFMQTLGSIRTVSDYLELFEDDSLLFAPGTSEAYSNGGYVILGAIIERVSGMPYHDYLRTHVFGPAAMTHTVPYDSRVATVGEAIGYTFQGGDLPLVGDQRVAGLGSRPGYAEPPAGGGRGMIIRRPGDSTAATSSPLGGSPRMRIIGSDGKELSPDQAAAAIAQHAASGTLRHANTSTQPSMSGPAGDHYSTVGDFLKLARALLSHRLLDSTRTAAVLGTRYAAGGDCRANGGGPGSNAEFSIFPSGDVMVVLSNYDPPAATTIAQFIRSRVAPGMAAR